MTRYFLARHGYVHVIRNVGDAPPLGPPFDALCNRSFYVVAGTLQITRPPGMPCGDCQHAASQAAERTAPR